MKIRRLQYNIDYVHIITFKEEYKQAVAPYFGFDNLRYGIDNENTINESIRLIFESEHLAISIRKEGLTAIFVGDIEDLLIQNGVIKIFWDIYEKIKLFQGYKRGTRHGLIAHAVEIDNETSAKKILDNNPYFKINPFGKLNDFMCVYEFEKSEKNYKYQFGSYSEKDIKTHDLMPFKSDINSDLKGALGQMCRLEISEINKTPNYSNFKSLLNNAVSTISSYRI